MKTLLKNSVVLIIVGVMMMLFALSAIAADQVELRMTWWGSQSRHDKTIEVIKAFEKAYPDIKIVYEFSGWRDYWTKLTPQAAGGNLPDLMQHNYDQLGEWVTRGLLVPLEEYVGSEGIDLTNVADSVLAGGTIDEHLYGIPLGTNSQAFILDVDAFEKAGVELPPSTWTWENFEKICLEISEKADVWGMGGTISDHQLWKSVYMGYGQWAYSNDGKSLGYEDDQILIDYVKMLLRLQEAGAYPTREVELSEYWNAGPEGSALVQGKAAMAHYWSNQIGAIWKAAGEDRNLVMTHVPRPKNGGHAANYIKPSMFFSITKHAKHPKEAALFINFFINSPEAGEILGVDRGVPVSSVVRKALKASLDKPSQEMFAYLERVQEDSSPIRPPDPPVHSEIYNNVYLPEFIDPVLLREISPEEGVSNLRKMAIEILSNQ